MSDAIFAAIAGLEAGFGWGRALDAGTGVHSLRWLSSTSAREVVAVTASASMERSVREALGSGLRARLVQGNYADPAFLAGERFEVVLADYLLGALDAYQPYGQDLLFPRLRGLLAPGGRLYVVGLEPSPARAEHAWGELVLAAERLRDAAILLAGERCYREYPREWVLRALGALDLELLEARRFPIRYGSQHVSQQLGVARGKLSRVEGKLARALREEATRIEARARAFPSAERRAFGEDYLVVARAPLASGLASAP